MENLGSFLSSIDDQLTTQLNSYGTYDYNWVHVDDTSGGTTYPSNYVIFDRVNIKSTVLDEVYHISEAIIGLVWEETLTATGATFKNSVATTTYAVTAGNVANDVLTNKSVAATTATAAGAIQYTGKETKLKGIHHLVDNVALELGSQSVSRNSALINLYNEMDLKKLKKDEYERLSDSLRWTCEDDDAKIIYTVDVNNNVDSIAGWQTIQKPLKSQTLDKRDRDFSSEYTYNGNSLFSNLGDIRYKKVLVSSAADKLVYKCYGFLPLKYVHNIFGKLPSVLQIDGFRLQLQMNIGDNNSWTIKYPATENTTLNTKTEITPSGFTTVQATGRTCPFYFGKAGWNLSDSSTDMFLHPSDSAVAFSVKCEMKINPGATEKMRLFIPYTKHINYNTIVKHPKARILYDDIFIDYGYNVQPNANFSRQFNFELKRMRWLFIFPFIRSTSNIDLSELRSPMFNAGVEVSPYWIDDFQIQINSNPVFKSPLKYKWQFYEYYKMFLGSNTDGNCLKSENMSGLITMDMYQKTHGIIAIDLQKVLSEQLDGSGKQILIEFRNRANIAYDFLFMISTQFEIGLDRNTCQIAKV